VSNVSRIKDEHYQFLTEYFSVSKLHDRYEALWADSVRVIENTGLEDKLRIDEESFQMLIIDYFSDIARLKDFHGVKLANTDKIYGYELFWFLRRHPIQLLEDIPNYFDINEKVALGVFIPKILAEAGLPCHKDEQSDALRKRVGTFINLLFYNFKHRAYTQQSLELMIQAFICGSCCKEIVINNLC
jgi:hypothetical protein